MSNLRTACLSILILTVVLTACASPGATPVIEAASAPTQTLVPTAAATPSPEPSPEPSATPIPEPVEPAFWPYPRYNLENTAAYAVGAWQSLEEPTLLWTLEDPDGAAFMSLFPVADDLDNDGRAEYVIGRIDPNTLEGSIVVFNIEDGSILWEKPLDAVFYWSTPVIADLNNDGQLDIVFASASGNLVQGQQNLTVLNGHDGSILWEHPAPTGGMGMTVADVDADGNDEIIITDYGNPRYLYLIDGATGNQLWKVETGGSMYSVPTSADLDGDGFKEIITHHHVHNPSRELLMVWDYQGNKLWEYLSGPTEEQTANAPPELEYTPDYGYDSVTVADFNADGELELGWGTRCNYYLLDVDGNLIWKTSTNVEGWGMLVHHMADGSINLDQHGIGGFMRYASAVGNIDDDPALEIVFPVMPEYRAHQYWPDGYFVYDRIEPANEIWALDGSDGSLQWVFEGTYVSDSQIDQMHEPILADLTGDGVLDVIALSEDRNIYGIDGRSGEKLWEQFFYLPDVWHALHLTFVPDGDAGIVMFTSLRRGAFYTLNALQVSERVPEP